MDQPTTKWPSMWSSGGIVQEISFTEGDPVIGKYPPITKTNPISNFKVYVSNSEFFYSNLPKISDYISIDNVTPKFNRELSYYAAICGTYVATYLCGVSTYHTSPHSNVNPIITSIMNFHVYLWIRRFIKNPSLLQQYSSMLGVISGNIPVKGQWEVDKFSDSRASIGIVYRRFKNEHRTVRNVRLSQSLMDELQQSADRNKINQKISNIHSEINNEISSHNDGHVDPPSDDNEEYPGDVSHFDAFEPLSEDDVRKLVVDSHKKSCYLDPVPTDFLVKCLDMLLPVITKIINISLETGYFPRDWKEAIILPRLKKSGLESAFENLRPISNLAYISKLIERAVYNQTHDHILRCGFYPVLQSAYRRYHSTETALLKVLNDILLSMNSQRVTLLVLLDLSSAFDTIDHGILLERLRSKFGIRGKVLSWFSSYLSGRSQRVMLNGTLSDSSDLNFGVPQGSCLGPLLFILYASKLFDIINNHSPDSHGFADDTQLYVSFKPDYPCDQCEAISVMESCVNDLRKWMIQDKLKLNDGKTELLIIGSKQQLEKLNPCH
ncbi:Hypothetical predicted protein, partial [Paramuricea clavata]